MLVNSRSRNIKFILIFLFALAAIWPLRRDLETGVYSVGDLRNRIVGARLQKDGKSPYFYKWKPEDGIRYYDPSNFGTGKVSAITASPFLHQLFGVWADLPQSRFAKGWVFTCYGMLLVMVTGFVFIARTVGQAAAIVAVAFCFLHTQAWMFHIYAGQIYIIIPFLISLLFFVVQYGAEKWWWFLFAGVVTAVALLIRPNVAVFFLPLLLLIPNYNKRQWVVFLVSVTGFLLLEFASPLRRSIWKDYLEAVQWHVKFHQQLDSSIVATIPDPKFPRWEDIDTARRALHPFKVYSENGNFFVVAERLFAVDVLPWHLTVAFVLSVLLLFGGIIWWRKKNPYGFTIDRIFFLGYGVYMLNDLFSPVYRHQYYTVQWLFPLFLTVFVTNGRRGIGVWLMGLGLLFNAIDSQMITMEHTIGEYAFLVGTFVLAFRRLNDPVNSKVAVINET